MLIVNYFNLHQDPIAVELEERVECLKQLVVSVSLLCSQVT